MFPRSVLRFVLVILFDVLIPVRPLLTVIGDRSKTRAAAE
jgi:hypothetical protein